jgi:hypothetical protein
LLISIDSGFFHPGTGNKFFFHCNLLGSAKFTLSAKNLEGSIGGKLSPPLILSRSAVRKKISRQCC